MPTAPKGSPLTSLRAAAPHTVGSGDFQDREQMSSVTDSELRLPVHPVRHTHAQRTVPGMSGYFCILLLSLLPACSLLPSPSLREKDVCLLIIPIFSFTLQRNDVDLF